MAYRNGGDWREIFRNSGVVVIDEDLYEKEIIRRLSRARMPIARPLDGSWKPDLFQGMPVIYTKPYGQVMHAIREEKRSKK